MNPNDFIRHVAVAVAVGILAALRLVDQVVKAATFPAVCLAALLLWLVNPDKAQRAYAVASRAVEENKVRDAVARRALNDVLKGISR